MLYEETKYWKEEYAKGKLVEEDMPGELRAILDGTAEKTFTSALTIFTLLCPWMITMFVLAFVQKREPEFYIEIKIFLQNWVIPSFYNYDPTLFVVIIALVLPFTIKYLCNKLLLE